MDRGRDPAPDAASGTVCHVALSGAATRTRCRCGVAGFCYSSCRFCIAVQSNISVSPEPQPVANGHAPSAKPKRSMSRRQKILFFTTGWLIVLMPFLFWWNTWFGRHLSDQQLSEYLQDEKKPRHIQHALVQLGDRMSHGDSRGRRWYPELLRLAANPVEEVRNTDAWVMGQDTSGTGFHETLLKMLEDASPMVRGNAALSLVRFGDASGRPQIVALLQAAHISAPAAGRITDSDHPGTAIHQAGLIAKLAPSNSSQTIEVRSPIPGRIRSVAKTGANVGIGAEVAVVDPATEQVWEGLRALYLLAQPAVIAVVHPYEPGPPESSNACRQQAIETERAIRAREDSK